jgi:hypothetical protein
MDHAEETDEFLNLSLIELVLVNHHPAFLRGLVVGVELASQTPQVLARMVEIDDLNGAGGSARRPDKF